MVFFLPPRKLLPLLVVGFLVALFLSLVIPVLFVSPILAAVFVSYLESRRLTFRRVAAWFVYVEGAAALVSGVLLVLVATPLSQMVSDALFVAVGGVVLGLLIIVGSFFLFWIGNILHGPAI